MKKLWNKIKEFFKKLFGHHDDSHADPTPTPTPAPVPTPTVLKYRKVAKGSTQGWYGRVNYWLKDKSLLKKELDAIVKHGASGYMIELAGWAGSTGSQWSDAWVKEIESGYRWLIKECRSRKLWLFVSIVNDNMGKGKYGDKGPALDKVYSTAQRLVKIVKNEGKDGVYVQPVAETQTTAGKKFEQYCISELKGFSLVYNGNGGHPSGSISGMGNYAVHPGKISQSVAGNAFAISDHGNIIRELNQGSKIDGHGDTGKIKTWAKNVKSWKCPVCGYYAFQVKDMDEAAIKALGNTLK